MLEISPWEGIEGSLGPTVNWELKTSIQWPTKRACMWSLSKMSGQKRTQACMTPLIKPLKSPETEDPGRPYLSN